MRMSPRSRWLALGLSLLLLCALFPAGAIATHNSQVLITAVYYDTKVTNEPDEAVRIHNPTGQSVSVAGWQICANTSCTTFPAGVSIGAGASIWVAREGAAFRSEWTFDPDYEMIDTDSNIPNMSGSPRLSNSGARVYLKNGTATVDMVVYGSASPNQGDPWSGAAVPGVAEGQLIHRAFIEADLDGAGTLHYVTDTDTAVDWQQGSEWRTAREFRRGQVFLGLPAWTVSGSLTAYVSPESSYSVLASLFDNATTSIDIQVYEFLSYQLYQKVSAALSRGVAVRLYHEGNPVGGLTDQAKWVAKTLTNEGAQVMFITSSTGYQRYNFTHSKFGIVDGSKVFVQSENLKKNGTPADNSYGNRGWGVVITSSAVASYFQTVFDHDWNADSPDTVLCQPNVTDFCSPPGSFTPDQDVPTGSYPAPYGSHTFSGTYTVTPVMAPDHGLLQGRAIRKALADAQKEILVEHLYLRKYWGPTNCNPNDCPNLYLKDLIDAARRGVRVRVTLSSAFLDPNDARDNTWTVEMLNQIAASESLDLEARLENTSSSGLEKIHNKGFVIDGTKVLVSSINGSENSPSENREASLLIENAAVAEFYRDAWHWTWHEGKDHSGNVQGWKHPVIAEVMYDPPGTESEREWLELYNPTTAAVSLTGWKLQDNNGTWNFPGGSSIGAGATLTIARTSTGFQQMYGFTPDIAGLTLSLANGSDFLLLISPQGNVISKVAWGSSKPNWSLSTAENTTLERCPVLRERFTRLDWLTGRTATPGSIPQGCQ
jgi:cardiolipin synthase A/B